MTAVLYQYKVEVIFDHPKFGFIKSIVVSLPKKGSHDAIEAAKKEVAECFGFALVQKFSFNASRYNRSVWYIVYDTKTFQIVGTPKDLREVNKKIESDKSVAYLNVTHPKNKETLAVINEVNGTDYE